MRKEEEGVLGFHNGTMSIVPSSNFIIQNTKSSLCQLLILLLMDEKKRTAAEEK